MRFEISNTLQVYHIYWPQPWSLLLMTHQISNPSSVTNFTYSMKDFEGRTRITPQLECLLYRRYNCTYIQSYNISYYGCWVYLGENLVEIRTVNTWVYHISRFYKQYKNILTLDPAFFVGILLHFHTFCIIFLNFCNSSDLDYSH